MVARGVHAGRLLVVPMIMVLGGLAALTTGCAATSSNPKPITQLNHVAGSWHGWIGCHGCSERFRASLAIREDGHWAMSIERNPSYHGEVGIVDGVLRWRQGKDWYGTVTVIEEGGREYLTFVRPDGVVWTEFDRELVTPATGHR